MPETASDVRVETRDFFTRTDVIRATGITTSELEAMIVVSGVVASRRLGGKRMRVSLGDVMDELRRRTTRSRQTV